MWHRSEEEVELIIADMINRTKGNYITQAVAFNKNSQSQMNLLKLALMSSYSFGGLMKKLIGEKLSSPEKVIENKLPASIKHDQSEAVKFVHKEIPIEKPVQIEDNINIKKESNVGNFL